ncbi:MAG: penicillin-binding transpeptidase domain-containing protein [Candidatus Promineifilaceae bacterium]
MIGLKHLPLLALLFGLTACGRLLPPIQDAYSESTLTPLPTATAAPSPTPIREGAEGIGLAFYRAWEQGDYLGMYSLLAPQSQALVDSSTFTRYYQDAMQTATVQAVAARPLAAHQQGARAEFRAQVVWETAVLGPISRDQRMELAYADGRWGVVWDEGLVLPELEGGGRLSLAVRAPARANIYDLNGQALAFQGAVVTLGVVPGLIADEAGLLATISPLLGRSGDELKAAYANALPDWYIPLGDVTAEDIEANFDRLTPFIGEGLVTEDRLVRLYPPGGIAPHAVGYMGPIPAERLGEYTALGYTGDEQVGLAGLELWGEKYLAGTRGGTLSVIGANGEQLAVVAETEAKQARSVYSSLDAELQLAVEQALADALATYSLGEGASAVVFDVHTGAIRALASLPDYDPAIFDALSPTSQIALGQVLNDPARPLLNRVAQGEYPSGSTFKIVTFTAGLNSGLYSPGSRYNSTGSWSGLGPNFIKYDWRPGGHGNVTLRQALVVSCNSCFYDVGFHLDAFDPFLLPNTARGFGLGAPTDVVGVPEAAGLVPDPEWKLANVGEGWLTGDSVNLAIGQGFLQVTPLQMARLVAAVANGGTLYRPTLVDRIGAGGGAPEESFPAEAQGQLPLSAENLAVIQESLRAAANSPEGTATHRFVGLPVPVAGKTGTAETVIGEPHAWFIGYAPAEPFTRPDGTPAEGPEIAVAVMVEFGGEGSAVAAPIFRRIVEAYYGVTPLQPYPWE